MKIQAAAKAIKITPAVIFAAPRSR